jgi:transcriptional regulator with XRE-family HTH domain
MELHYGQIVERTIRRKGYSISELARLTKVNRRSVYNWFNQKQLKPEIIFRIGTVVNHDFSTEFPGLFPDEELNRQNKFVVYNNPAQTAGTDLNFTYWKDKYIDLLEKYNQLLLLCIETKN